jgi:5,10-methylene-tetrahydrofolate dehydrogenase/methenyl tetrahydrofolate cyclohydrolase
MIIDGRAIASDIVSKVKSDSASLGHEIVVRAVVMSPTSATESYLRMKSERAHEAGMQLDVVRVADDAGTEEVINAVRAAGADCVIVQLPLPPHIDTQAVVDSIPVEQDADVLSTAAYENFTQQKTDSLLPPVVGAIQEILEHAEVALAGKQVAIVGNGKLVGQPAAIWLKAQGADVRVFTRDTFTHDSLKFADIVISGTGSPHLIEPSMLKSGVVLIDAGTSESNGSLAGDADPSCADVASVFTPVPGGVGPVAVACLFKNAAQLVHLRKA